MESPLLASRNSFRRHHPPPNPKKSNAIQGPWRAGSYNCMQPVTGIQGVDKTQKERAAIETDRQTVFEYGVPVEPLFQPPMVPRGLATVVPHPGSRCISREGPTSSAWEPRHVTACLQPAQCSMSRKVLASPVLQCCASCPNWSVTPWRTCLFWLERETERQRKGAKWAFRVLCCYEYSGTLARNTASFYDSGLSRPWLSSKSSPTAVNVRHL